MEVYRISKEKYASKLTASGNAARWNYRGEKVIYTASSRALASLELIVHLSGKQLGTSFKISVIYVPDDLYISTIPRTSMPNEWNGLTAYKATQALGSGWIASEDSCILRVPSSIVIHEYNYIINVHHPDFEKLSIIDIEDHLFDPRLLLKMKDQ